MHGEELILPVEAKSVEECFASWEVLSGIGHHRSFSIDMLFSTFLSLFCVEKAVISDRINGSLLFWVGFRLASLVKESLLGLLPLERVHLTEH